MEIEAIFLNHFSIQKKPQDIFNLIEMAIGVAESKYLDQLEKRRNRIIKTLLNPGRFDWVDDEEEDDDTSTLDQQEDDDTSTLDQQEDQVTKVEEEKQQITAPTNQKTSIKIRLKIMNSDNCNAVEELKKRSKTDLVDKQLDADKEGTQRQSHNNTTMPTQVVPLQKHNNCNAVEELKKRSESDLVDKRLDADKEVTRRQSTIMGSRKRNVPTQVAPPPRKIQLLSDFSFEKQLDGDKKQKHKGFKKMESLTKNKTEEQKDCPSGLTKSSLPTKRVQVVSDCSPQKQNNCSSII